MAAGVAFLQSELEDSAPSNHGPQYKLGNVDLIRGMLREQQRSMGALHANALFREFRGLGRGGQLACIPDVPQIDDFQAEGQSRLFELIKQTALKDEKPLRGVWASFGKPYICLGDPQEPQGRLPSLHRDEIANQEKAKNAQRTGNKQKKPAAGGAAQQGGEAIPGSAGPPGTAPQPPGTAGSRGPSRGGSARRIGTAASLASLEGTLPPQEVLELRLNKIKTVMRFANNDVAEVSFPQGPLQQAGFRRTRIKAAPGSFVDPDAAGYEVTDPFLAYGQPPIPQHELKPPSQQHSKQQPAVTDQRSAVFITQGTGAAACEDDTSYRRSYNGGSAGTRRSSLGFTERPGYMSQDQWEGAGQGLEGGGPGDPVDGAAGPPGHAGAGGAPHFKPLVSHAVPMRGDEDNPVYTWHNSFLQVRHAGRAALQAALYQRAEGRFRARTVGPMAANLSSILMADLDIVKGRQVPYATLGQQPASPYTKMDASWQELQERAAHAARVAAQLDPEELRLLQRFYDQLCALVEAQRMSDPLLLMVVHKVKGLLEEGTFLQRVMFEAVVGHIGRFAAATGIRKHNKYLLSVFTFIAKCTGVGEADFESVISQAGLCQVVYNTPLPPSQMVVPSSPSADDMQGGITSRRGASRARSIAANSSGIKSPPRRGPSMARLVTRVSSSINRDRASAGQSFVAGAAPSFTAGAGASFAHIEEGALEGKASGGGEGSESGENGAEPMSMAMPE